MSNCMLSNPGKSVTIYNIPGFVKDVLSQCLSQSNILSGEIVMEPQIIADIPLESSVSTATTQVPVVPLPSGGNPLQTPEKTDNGNGNKKIKLIATQTKRREKQHKTKKSVSGVKTKISKSKKLSVKSSDSDTDAEDSDYLCHDNSDRPLEEYQDENSSWFCFLCGTDEMLDMRLCVSCQKYVHEI
nr:unnamed protein product [Callosobruchus analis]